MPSVRLTAYPVHWLTDPESFAVRKTIIWSTGEKTQPGDIQVFAVSASLRDRRRLAHDPRTDLAGDPRRDAVHSIWKALTTPLPEFGSVSRPIQAKFKLLVRLGQPVRKEDLIQVGLLEERWPETFRGKMLKTQSEIETLANTLAMRNPQQRSSIFNALGLHLTDGNGGQSATLTEENDDRVSDNGEAADEQAFLEGENRAICGIARNPRLRAAAKKRWGLKCCCCGFDFEQFYGSVAKGLAIVHHLQLFTEASDKPRTATVEDVRVVCANCLYVIHVRKHPIHVDELNGQLSQPWTAWSEDGIA